MLPKINRIKKKKDFDIIFKTGKSFKTSLLVLKIARNGQKHDRFGFIVSKKISKNAVVRNKIRRILARVAREVVGENGIDFVFIALHGIEKKDFSEIHDSVIKLLNKI
jgi:ribonuclease P protein component